jgi:hypothetical protein
MLEPFSSLWSVCVGAHIWIYGYTDIYIYIYIYIYTHTHARTHARTHTRTRSILLRISMYMCFCVHACMCGCVCVFSCVSLCVRAYMFVHVYFSHLLCACVCVCVCICIRSPLLYPHIIYISIHTHIQMNIHACIQTHTYHTRRHTLCMHVVIYRPSCIRACGVMCKAHTWMQMMRTPLYLGMIHAHDNRPKQANEEKTPTNSGLGLIPTSPSSYTPDMQVSVSELFVRYRNQAWDSFRIADDQQLCTVHKLHARVISGVCIRPF